MRRLLKILVIVGLMGLLLATPALGAQITLTWSAGSSGGGWYQMAGGIAAIIKAADADIVIKVVPGGGLQNPAVVANKTVEMAWGLPFLNAAAFKGLAPFDKPLGNLRALAGGMSLNYFHFYLGAESPLKTMDEVFGEKKPVRLALSQSGSSDTWVFEKVLEAYGTDMAGLRKAGFHLAQGNYSFQANQFKDKNVDGVFTFLAVPGAAVIEASVGRSLKLIDFSDKALKFLEPYGITQCQIPPQAYPKAANAGQAVNTACSGSVITVSQDMSDELAFRLTKAFNESLDKVRQVHASLRTYQVADGPTGCGLPLHPGAIKYYKEKGVLK